MKLLVPSKSKLKTVHLTLITVLLFSLPAFALPSPTDTILAPPPSKNFLKVYKKNPADLSPLEKARIKIHGLRMAPLHPLVWGVRYKDRTSNRNLVPMRPFILRESENTDFSIVDLEVDFKFRKVSKKHMLAFPESKAGVFDIEFAGKYVKPKSSSLEKIDSSYGLRLSIFPKMPSGIFYRNRNVTKIIMPAEKTNLGNKSHHSVKMSWIKNKLVVFIDKQTPLEFDQSGLDKGLVSLQTDWLPIYIKHFEIKGKKLKKKSAQPIVLSGLVNLKE